MRKQLLTSAAAIMLVTGYSYAQESATPPPNAPAAEQATQDSNQTTNSTNDNMDVGVAAGGTTGAIAGAVVGGPVGAVVGGFAGAMLGAAATVPQPAVDYVVANPVEPVTVQGELAEGTVLQAGTTLSPIPDYPEYAYVYVNGRPVIVRMESREVVYSPGYVIPPQTVTYVQENPVDPVAVGNLTVGAAVPADVQLVQIPSDPAYAYVYTENGPVLVNQGTRTVVWVR